MRDIFSFFEKPKEIEGEVVASVVETVTVLAASLQAMGVRLGVRDEEVGATVMSAEQIREASHGEVKSRDTFDETTLQPVPGGLFCPRLFGPVNDYACACGKYMRMKHRGVVCDKCGVEVIPSRVRRERFGHIPLPSPCLNPLLSSAIATLLGIAEDDVRSVARGASTLPGGDATGGRALWDALASLDLESMEAMEAGERGDLAGSLVAAGVPATALMLEVLPVLPPSLRPIMPVREGWTASDINTLYQHVLDCRDRPAELDEAIDRLFVNEWSRRPLADEQGRTLHALASTVDGLAGKLLSKPTDYSGLAHLTVDPTLDEGQCRVPRELLVELYRPWAYGLLESMGYATTIKSAKRMVEAGKPEAMQAIELAGEGRVVLLSAGACAVSRRARVWDAAAIAVDESTAQRLDSIVVSVHVPLSHEAALQCEGLDDHARVGPGSRSGWLSRAAIGTSFVQGVVAAVVSGERDPMDDPWTSIAFGRPPPEPDADALEQWVRRDDARKAAIGERHEAERAKQKAATGGPTDPYLDYSVDELEISVRLANCLQNANLHFVREVCARTEAEMLKTNGFGRQELKELEKILADFGLSLGMRI